MGAEWAEIGEQKHPRIARTLGQLALLLAAVTAVSVLWFVVTDSVTSWDAQTR